MDIVAIFSIVILILSAVVHEFSHGYAAYLLGDPTAQYEGRLTLNPLPHLDIFGSILLPLLLVISHSPFIIGWAKPVPYNPYNLKNRRVGEILVAAAGPVSNIVLALIAGLIINFVPISQAATQFVFMIVLINILLAVFNLMPVPPLDGSKILFNIFPRAIKLRSFMERYSFVFFLLFVFFLWEYIAPVVFMLSALVAGL